LILALRPSFILAILVAILIVLLWIRLKRDQFFVLLVSVVVALVLGEVLCRALGLGAPESFTYREVKAERPDASFPYEPHSQLVYEYPDNPRGYFDDDNRVIGHINSLGFRGPEPRDGAARPPLRVVMLGDSFALGFGVRDEHTLPAQLEGELRSRGLDAEVLNLGASDTGTADHVTLLEHYAIGFRPDVVVILFFLNDAERVGTNTLLFRRLAFGRLRARSYLANAVATTIERAAVTRLMVRHYIEGYEDASPGWVEARSALRRADRLAREHGFDLVVAVHPVFFRLDEGHPFAGIHRTISGFCEAEGIQHVDLLDVFLGLDDTELWVHGTDHHPNEVAHGRSAAVLADHLARTVLGGGEALDPP
jgi:hypothetical protein